MTNEELALMIQNGQTEAVLPLWQRVERFVAKQADKWSKAWTTRRVEFEDLYQSGFLAMMKAAQTYDPDKDVKFLTWMGYFIKTAFSYVAGCRTKAQNNDPLNEYRSLWEPLEGGTDDLTIGDMIPDPVDYIGDTDERVYRDQLHDELERALSTLPEDKSKVLRLRFYDGLTLKDTAKVCGITAEAARQREGRALKELRSGKQAARLRAYVDERTPFYSARGVHSVESLTIKRERLINRCG